MNWKIKQLIEQMAKDDECDEYVIYIPRDGQVIMAYDEQSTMRERRRQVEQVEIHGVGEWNVVMLNDYDNPIHDVTNIKFEVHEAVLIIG